MRSLLLALVCSTLPATAQIPQPASAPASPADTIYYHGTILTGVGLPEPTPERVTALAVAHGLVQATGSDAAVLQHKGPKTQLVDLGGAFVMPGIDDAHTHIAEAGLLKLSVDLTGSRSLTEMKERIAAAARSAPPGHWLQGGGWDHTLWAGKQTPTRADLDPVTGDHPAAFSRVDGHILVANSAALKAAGITAKTPDPQGGKIDKDAGGQPTGIIRDLAMNSIFKVVPLPTHDERKRALSLALADAAQHGVTSVQDNSPWDDFLVLEELECEDHLPVRVSEWLAFNDPVDVLKQHRAAHPAKDRMLHTGMLKGFMDGSLGSRTAALNAPYSDDPGNSGLPYYKQPQLDAMTKERAAARFQIGFHAIGDRAVGMALNAFAVADPVWNSPDMRTTGDPSSGDAQTVNIDHIRERPRIEHSQIVAPADFARYKQLGVIASMQPNHLLTDMAWAIQRIGPERARYAYAWKSFLDHGVPLAFGTDYPVEPITPFRGIYSAVTRMNEAGTQTFFPEEKLTMGQALYAYTQGSAYAEFAEPYKGKLAPGFVADLIVLDRDLTRIPPREILGTKVLRTVVDGHTVYVSDVQAR